MLSKLHAVYPPAPKPALYCEDESVIGAPFYRMERRRGIVLRRKLPEGFAMDPPTMNKLNRAFIDNLVAFHHIDYEAAGLGELGKPVGYVARQVEGWNKRYVACRTADVPEMELLMGCFPKSHARRKRRIAGAQRLQVRQHHARPARLDEDRGGAGLGNVYPGRSR